MRFAFRALLPVLMVGSMACSGSSTSPSSGSVLNLMMTDAPFQDAKAVLVTFNEVSAHASGGDWKTLPFAGNPAPLMRTCDLKKLEGSKQDILGTGTLAAGHYTQVRLVVSSATIYFDNPTDPLAPACGDAATFAAPGGNSAPLTVVSGDVKLTREFDVPQAGVTTMVVDFNGAQSIFLTGTGNYQMTPVIAVVSVQ
jgi:uncharacterized protein DUF4382